jgi:hypothetical protein
MAEARYSVRTATLVLSALVWAYLSYLFVFLLTSYNPALPGYTPPFGLFVIDTVNLFIHEAGHLFLRPFGMTSHILGGSILQILLPAALAVVTGRQNFRQVGFPAFWLGESMVNVSAYILDAPYRKLPLIARGLIHDWNWLLNGDADVSDPLGQIVFWTGILICAASIGAGIRAMVMKYREDALRPEGDA